MPLPFMAIATIANIGYHAQRHFRKSPAPLKSFLFGIGYAGGTNVGWNAFNEYITPHLIGNNRYRYTGRPQYVSRL